jgi:hypothetical protein
MARHEWGAIPCDCGGKLLLRWSLNYAKMPPESEQATPGEAAEGEGPRVVYDGFQAPPEAG